MPELSWKKLACQPGVSACRSIPKLRFNSLAQRETRSYKNNLFEAQNSQVPGAPRDSAAHCSIDCGSHAARKPNACRNVCPKNADEPWWEWVKWRHVVRALGPRGQHKTRGAKRPCLLRFSIEKDRFVFSFLSESRDMFSTISRWRLIVLHLFSPVNFSDKCPLDIIWLVFFIAENPTSLRHNSTFYWGTIFSASTVGRKFCGPECATMPYITSMNQWLYFFYPNRDSANGWCFGFLASPYERDCYLWVPLESQTASPNHQFNISLVIDDDFWLVDWFLCIYIFFFQKYDEIINRFFWYFGDFCWKVGELDIFFCNGTRILMMIT